jgi:hypothetical protein
MPPKLIMKIGPLLDALEPGFHCVRTQWIRGVMAFQLTQRTRSVMVMVRGWPESGFQEGTARLRPLADRKYSISPPRDALLATYGVALGRHEGDIHAV